MYRQSGGRGGGGQRNSGHETKFQEQFEKKLYKRSANIIWGVTAGQLPHTSSNCQKFKVSSFNLALCVLFMIHPTNLFFVFPQDGGSGAELSFGRYSQICTVSSTHHLPA
jgi:hypothetical protein